MPENIVLSDPKLKIELVASRLDFPTTMAFLVPDEKTIEKSIFDSNGYIDDFKSDLKLVNNFKNAINAIYEVR